MLKIKWFFLILLILLPRLVLLGNGLDQQRMWDTVMPDVFNLLSAVKENQVSNFLAENHKYPLLGSYALTPAVVAYYGVKKAIGQYNSPADFIDSFALSETNVFFWVRVEMLMINLVALLSLYFLTRRFLSELKRAKYYVVLIAAVNFFITLFSVQPRIHSFAFLGTVGVLYASFLLIERKTWRTYFLAFIASALAASVAQSDALTIILPVLAHFYDGTQKKWRWREKAAYFNKKLLVGLLLFFLFLIGVGYPQIIMALWNGGVGMANVHSPEHSQPKFELVYFFPFIRNYFFVSEFIAIWIFIAWIICIFKRNEEKLCSIRNSPYATIAVIHVLLFFLTFGFADVATGRFVLAVLPSMLFIFAFITASLEKKKWFIYPLCVAIILQGYSIIMLTRIGMGGDTRSLATNYLLSHTVASDKILSNVDHHLLGIVPNSLSLQAGNTGTMGRTDYLIMDKGLNGKKSRFFIFLDLKSNALTKLDLNGIKYVVVSGEDHELFNKAKLLLLASGFKETKAFIAKKNENKRDESTFISWDMIAPAPHWPLPFIIDQFRSVGPNIFLFSKNVL